MHRCGKGIKLSKANLGRVEYPDHAVNLKVCDVQPKPPRSNPAYYTLCIWPRSSQRGLVIWPAVSRELTVGGVVLRLSNNFFFIEETIAQGLAECYRMLVHPQRRLRHGKPCRTGSKTHFWGSNWLWGLCSAYREDWHFFSLELPNSYLFKSTRLCVVRGKVRVTGVKRALPVVPSTVPDWHE